MSGTSARPISEREFLAMAGGFLDRNYEQSLTYERAAAARIGAGTQIFAIEAGADVLALALVRVKAVPGLGRGIAWVPSGPLVVRQGLAPDAAHLAAVLGALRQRVAVEEGHILRVRLAGQSLVDPAVSLTGRFRRSRCGLLPAMQASFPCPRPSGPTPSGPWPPV